MENKINNIITKYKELRNTAWDNYRNVCNQEQEEIGNVINFKGKYLKILDYDKYVYIYVFNQYFTNDQERSNDFFIRLVGPGVTFYINEDLKYIYGEFDEAFTHELNVRNIKSDLKNIAEISRKDFIIECSKHFDAARRSFTKLL